MRGHVSGNHTGHFPVLLYENHSGRAGRGVFGIYDICGKGAAFTGTLLVSAISQLTGSTNAGVGSLSVMFLLGFVLFRVAASKRESM